MKMTHSWLENVNFGITADDLKEMTVPVLVMHGDDGQIVPYADSGQPSAKLLKHSTLKTYKGFPHGMATTEAETINADLLGFHQRLARLCLRPTSGIEYLADSRWHGSAYRRIPHDG